MRDEMWIEDKGENGKRKKMKENKVIGEKWKEVKVEDIEEIKLRKRKRRKDKGRGERWREMGVKDKGGGKGKRWKKKKRRK